MYDPYKELGNLISDLDADIEILECMTMNGENEKANSYLMGAKLAIQNALSNVSEALLEVTAFAEDE